MEIKQIRRCRCCASAIEVEDVLVGQDNTMFAFEECSTSMRTGDM